MYAICEWNEIEELISDRFFMTHEDYNIIICIFSMFNVQCLMFNNHKFYNFEAHQSKVMTKSLKLSSQIFGKMGEGTKPQLFQLK